MKITPIAKKILSAYPYFENSKYAILIDAIPFSENESPLLAGPFLKKYGLVKIKHYPNELSIDEIYQKGLADSKNRLINYPYKYRKRVEESFNNKSEHWYCKTTKTSISDIDISCGANNHGFELIGYSGVFATTEKGITKMRSVLSEAELIICDQYCISTHEEYFKTYEYSILCKERPYLVYLCGNDDASWSKCTETLDEAELLVADLKKYGFGVVQEQMIFTN